MKRRIYKLKARGELLIMAYKGRLRPKRVPFLGFRKMNVKGRDFTSWGMWKGRKSVISVFKKPKKLTDAFYGCEMSKNVLILWFIQDRAFTALQRIQSSKL